MVFSPLSSLHIGKKDMEKSGPSSGRTKSWRYNKLGDTRPYEEDQCLIKICCFCTNYQRFITFSKLCIGVAVYGYSFVPSIPLHFEWECWSCSSFFTGWWETGNYSGYLDQQDPSSIRSMDQWKNGRSLILDIVSDAQSAWRYFEEEA